MSRLLIITRPSLVAGFHLAGIEAWAAEDVETAQELVCSWLDSDEVNLLAIDDGLLERMDPDLVKRLDASLSLSYLAIPGGQPLGPEASRWHRIAELIRHAVGFHITFKGKTGEAEQ
jgi:vacuolar-type H+-ATPase subunit F/Vma7